MKTRSAIKTVGLVFVLSCMVGWMPHASAAYVDYTFAELDDGDLVGQDGWTLVHASARETPIVREIADVDGNDTNVAGYNATDPTYAQPAKAKREISGLSLTGTETLVFTFDVIRDGTGAGTASVIIGEDAWATWGTGVNYIGMSGNRWRLSGENAIDSAGNEIQPTSNKWYRVRSVWDLDWDSEAGTVGTGTLEIMNLTDGETEYTTLYFDQDQTVSTQSLNIYGDPTKWTHWAVATGGGEQSEGVPRTGAIDNITIIPEPGSLSLMGSAFVAAMLIRRRLRR